MAKGVVIGTNTHPSDGVGIVIDAISHRTLQLGSMKSCMLTGSGSPSDVIFVVPEIADDLFFFLSTLTIGARAVRNALACLLIYSIDVLASCLGPVISLQALATKKVADCHRADVAHAATPPWPGLCSAANPPRLCSFRTGTISLYLFRAGRSCAGPIIRDATKQHPVPIIASRTFPGNL